MNGIRSHTSHHIAVNVAIDVDATEAVDADVEAVNAKTVITEIANVVAAIGEKKPTDKR